MADPKKFFKENINLLPSPTAMTDAASQREYNLNSGLLAMCKQLDDLQSELKRLRNFVETRIR